MIDGGWAQLDSKFLDMPSENICVNMHVSSASGLEGV